MTLYFILMIFVYLFYRPEQLPVKVMVKTHLDVSVICERNLKAGRLVYVW